MAPYSPLSAPTPPEGMQLRPARDQDGEAVQRLIFGILQAYGLRPAPDSTDRDLFELETFYFQRGGYFGVLEEHGEIIGTFGLAPESSEVCELRKMYLSDQHRGRGLGKLLLESALSQAQQLGFHELVLETASVLKEAIQLYQRYGFEPYQPSHMASRCDKAFRRRL